MPGFGSRCLMCAIAMMLARTSATKARSWRYYGYHWHWYVQDALEALQKGIDAIRPVFSQFESELTDVQRVKLDRGVNVSTEIAAVAH
jgi:hypothetical protein